MASKDSAELFFPGRYPLVICEPPKKKLKKDPTQKELELLALRAEGFSNDQISENFSLSGDTIFSRITSVNQRLGTNRVCQPIAVCFDRGFLKIDPDVAEASKQLVGTNPYGLTDIEIAALRRLTLNTDIEGLTYTNNAIDKAAERVRRKMLLHSGSTPVAPAILYGYISEQDIKDFTQTSSTNPKLNDKQKSTMKLVALGINPSERAKTLGVSIKRSDDIIQEVNAIMGTNNSIQSLLAAFRMNLLNSYQLAEKITASKPYSVDNFADQLPDEAKAVLGAVVENKSIDGKNREIARELGITAEEVKGRFRRVSLRYGLRKIPAIVVYYAATKNNAVQLKIPNGRTFLLTPREISHIEDLSFGDIPDQIKNLANSGYVTAETEDNGGRVIAALAGVLKRDSLTYTPGSSDLTYYQLKEAYKTIAVVLRKHPWIQNVGSLIKLVERSSK